MSSQLRPEIFWDLQNFFHGNRPPRISLEYSGKMLKIFQNERDNLGSNASKSTRPVLSEIQALVTKTAFPSPRRTASGFDYNRMYLLLAVLEKRAGYVFGNQDVYINIIGGLKLDETACDLPVCLAMASSLLDLPVPEKTLAIGEVGLGGEVRSVPHLETRLREAQRVGFDTAIVPKHNLNMLDAAQFPGLRLVGVAYLREAINAIKINK